jgi:hypothetical protein
MAKKRKATDLRWEIQSVTSCDTLKCSLACISECMTLLASDLYEQMIIQLRGR